MSTGTKIMSFNCRSIRSKVPQVLDIAIENHIDIILLQETWLRNSDSAIVAEILEYNFNLFQDRKPRKSDTGGGVAILYNKSIKIKQVKTEKFASFELVSCVLQCKQVNVILSTLYYPGYSLKHKYTHSKFLSELSDFLNCFCADGIHIVTGDFNIHYEDHNREETKLLFIMENIKIWWLLPR